jgi:hypothetical protein
MATRTGRAADELRSRATASIQQAIDTNLDGRARHSYLDRVRNVAYVWEQQAMQLDELASRLRAVASDLAEADDAALADQRRRSQFEHHDRTSADRPTGEEPS